MTTKKHTAPTATAPKRPGPHLQRTQPIKIRTSGLHSLQDTASNFCSIQVIAPVPADVAAKQAKEQLWNNASTSRDYAGAELAPYTGRPGAMDAFDQPSRVGSTLFYRDGRTEKVK